LNTHRYCPHEKDHSMPFARTAPRLAGALALALTLGLAGCGGGDVVVDGGPLLNVGVTVGTTAFDPVGTGQVLDVVAAVGQPITFDANERVVWNFAVNGSPLFSSGTTVVVGGVRIDQVQIDPSRVVLDSGFVGPALLPIDVVLTATSTFDAAQVATIHVRLQ
jgi:hypothetical protein